MYHVINNVLMGLNRVGDVFYDYAASVFIQSALLVIVLFAIDLLLRKRIRAIFRYCVWLLVLVKLILPPMLSLPTGIGYWVGDHIPAVPGASNMAFNAVALEHAGPSGEMPHVRPAENIAGHDPALAPADSALTPLTWQAVVFLLWLAGVLAFLAVLVQRIRFVKGLVAASCPAGDELTGLLEQCRRQMAVRRDIKLRLSETIPSPAVCGLFRPTVLMPISLVEKLSSEGLRATLIHELAHIKRGDLWVNSVQTFLQVVYFYNPFVWFANSIIRKVCEEAVDETVLVALGGQAKDYSNTLIDIGEIVFWKADLGLRLIGVAESKKALQWRIRHMLNRPIPKSSKLGALGIAALLAIAAVLLPMAKAEKSNESNKPVTMENERKSAKTLHQAVADGDLAEVRRLIAEGADVNAKNQRDMTPLMWGWYTDGLTKEVAELLIEHGADVDAQDDEGMTSLHGAIYVDIGKDIVSLLISKSTDVNLTTEEGWTSLHYAIVMGDIDTVKLLVDKGADFNVKNQEGWTSLRRAALDGRRDMVEIFIGRGADTSSFHMAAFMGDLSRVKEFVEKGTEVDTKDEAGWTALFWAASAGQEEVAEFLINNNVDISANDGSGQSLLHQAAQAHTDAHKLVELLIAKGADVNAKNARGEIPLHLACYAGNKDVAELLIAKGADVNAKNNPIGNNPGRTPLHNAASGGHIEVAELLISQGADVNADNAENNIRFSYNPTPLHMAAMREKADMVKFLIDKGADINASSGFFGRTPLQQVIITGKIHNVELLIDKGADINASTRIPAPLALAVLRGYTEIVELLITKGADVNASDRRGRTTLDLAEEKGHTEIVELLEKHGAKEESPSSTDDPEPTKSLHQAAADGDIEQVKRLIAEGADVNVTDENNKTPLCAAAYNKGHAEVIRVLLANGAKVDMGDSYGYTPLFYAIWSDDEEAVKALISGGADFNKRPPNEKYYHPLVYAIWQDQPGIVRVLLDAGANAEQEDFKEWSPLQHALSIGNTHIVTLLANTDDKVPDLHRAALRGDLSGLKELLGKGADLEEKDGFGQTPLYYALAAGQGDAAKFLLLQGADTNLKARWGRTLLHQASRAGLLEIVQILLARDVPVDAVSTSGQTPLHEAAGAGHKEIAELLISKGASVDSKDRGNRTPLYMAAGSGKADMVELLIDKGADINASNNQGRTPLYFAEQRGHTEIVELLLKHGAKE